MRLLVITLSGTLVDKQVESVSVPGAAGRFMILENHAPIASTLSPGPVVWTEGGREHSLEIEIGVLHARDNVIKIIGSCVTPSSNSN